MKIYNYQRIENIMVENLPELLPAAEQYWNIEGPPGQDSGAYIFFESIVLIYVTTLLATTDTTVRNNYLRRAFDFVESMFQYGDNDVKNLAYIGLLESQGRWWLDAAKPFLGEMSLKQLDVRQPLWRSVKGGESPEAVEFIDLYGVRPIVSQLLACN